MKQPTKQPTNILSKQVEHKVNELASSVMKGEMLRSFLRLDIKAKLTGLATFAHMAGEEKVRDGCLLMLKKIK